MAHMQANTRENIRGCNLLAMYSVFEMPVFV